MSPKKSIEGVIVATLVTILVSVTLVSAFVDAFQDKRIETLLLGLVVAAAATFGDLAESLLKRDLGIKDMGACCRVTAGCSTGSTLCCSWRRPRSCSSGSSSRS